MNEHSTEREIPFPKSAEKSADVSSPGVRVLTPLAKAMGLMFDEPAELELVPIPCAIPAEKDLEK